eukprot:TRINITY_DN2271_c0_g1_i15.p1 TRINITY_DN2271_c0_g1~~TRINITY_DN2271_c0_g1_i15.p1  ORF type:complete len:107 (-),score=11.38 TRINITY_DN2271_c0_g1_i15:50-370(-)
MPTGESAVSTLLMKQSFLLSRKGQSWGFVALPLQPQNIHCQPELKEEMEKLRDSNCNANWGECSFNSANEQSFLLSRHGLRSAAPEVFNTNTALKANHRTNLEHVT